MSWQPTIGVTGAGGLLGSAVCSVLEFFGYTTQRIDCDISDVEAVEEWGRQHTPCNVIVHTAAMTEVDECERNQECCMAVNVGGTQNITDLAKSHSSRIIYISTVSVFDGVTGNYKESDTPSPNNVYNISKAEGEKLIGEYDRGLVLRLNLIGIHPKGSRGKNFFEWLVDSIKQNKNIRLFNDVFINPLSNITIAHIIKDIIEKKPEERVLHIGSKNVLSKAQIGQLVIDRMKTYLGKADFVSVDSGWLQAFRPKQMWLNADLIQKKYGIVMPALEAEVDRLLTSVLVS